MREEAVTGSSGGQREAVSPGKTQAEGLARGARPTSSSPAAAPCPVWTHGGGTSSPLSCACRGGTRLSRWRVGLLVKKCDKWLGIRSSSPSPPFRNVNGFLLDLSCVLKSESQSLLNALERFCRICSRERGRGCGLELSWPQAEWPRCDQGVGYFCRQGGEIGFRKRRDFSPIRANCF